MISNQNKIRTIMPFWAFAGAVIILFPIFAFITMESINRQKENNIKLLIEKGAALIRSFEAGTRAGIFGYGETRQLQRLLYETAKQPDIKYLLVADINGTIIAHSDLSHTGDKLNLVLQEKQLDLSKIAGSSDLYWHIVDGNKEEPYFLLFRSFSPSGGAQVRLKISRFSNSVIPKGVIDITAPERIVLAGFDMSSVNSMEAIHTRNSIVTGVILFLAGIAGVVFLFIFQGYRSTKTSLSRIKVFSNTLVENLPIGLVALNQNYKIVLTNNIAKSILLINDRDVSRFSTEELLPDLLYKKILKLGRANELIEETIDCCMKNGQTLPLEISASALKDHESKLSGYICLFKDLSEVHDLKKEVERSRRLASVGKLAAGVAHEIRNPLSSIKGFATYFKERYKNNDEDQQISNIMIQEVDRLNLVIGQLLEFARPVTISIRAIELKPFFDNSIKLIEIRADKFKVGIISDLPLSDESFNFDPDKISQVLLNVYINAIDSMEKGGTLFVKAFIDYQQKVLKIQIKDTGTGIKEEDLTHIFDPYFTTKSSGTGLGLAVSHNIIEQHQGDFLIESRFGEGTVVTVVLPEKLKGKNEK